MAKQTPEGRVKAVVKKMLEERGAYFFLPVSNGMGAMGIPDILACLQGRFIGIEAKAGKNKPTDLQTLNLKRIHDAGGLAMVVNETNLSVLEVMLDDPIHARSNYSLHTKPLTEADTGAGAPAKRKPKTP
jgi:hypothetical protein